jgi:hypothetical protein
MQKKWMIRYKTFIVVVILDNLERLMDYTPIGSRFSNMILQVEKSSYLLVLCVIDLLGLVSSGKEETNKTRS